ncbi:MAG: hypothetical protein H6700_01690 [Myxococcales bacterium]|nr:hypothetical protein [Myxococcales bacterium]MCB9519768.1 hypothetical protein [Myxococcales bacterium]MCB9530459.1 hypothetical protein [Myxococcales bacterium]
MMRLLGYLGVHIDELLTSEPLSRWDAIRSEVALDEVAYDDLDSPTIIYEFVGRGVSVKCDAFDKIATVFVERGGDGESLVDDTFRMTRSQVLERFGSPERSGSASWSPFPMVPGFVSRFPRGSSMCNSALHATRWTSSR